MLAMKMGGRLRRVGMGVDDAFASATRSAENTLSR